MQAYSDSDLVPRVQDWLKQLDIADWSAEDDIEGIETLQ